MRNRILRLGVVPAVLLALILSTSVLSQSRSELLARIDERVETTMERDHIVRTSIGVKKSGEIIVAKGYGYADLENDVRATEHTVYRIGSITKQFKAASVIKLVEVGQLRLDDDLTVIVLSNTGSANPAVLESEIARAVLGIPTVEIQEVDLTTAQLEMYAGTYDPGCGPIPASVRDDRLFMMGRALRPIGDHCFVSSINPHHRVTFSVEGDRALSVRIEREGQVTEAPRVP